MQDLNISILCECQYCPLLGISELCFQIRCLQFDKHLTLTKTIILLEKKKNSHILSASLTKAESQTLHLAFLASISPIIASRGPSARSRHYQMVRLTPAQIEPLSPCAARTSSQCKRVLGISSSGSGFGRAPSLGLATTTGSGARCGWNSTTWSCFLLASVWWVSCRVEEDKRWGRREMLLRLQTQRDNSSFIFSSCTPLFPNCLRENEWCFPSSS